MRIGNCSVPLTVTAKIRPKSPLAMDFSTPESLSFGQRSKCADLLNSYENCNIFTGIAQEISWPDGTHSLCLRDRKSRSLRWHAAFFSCQEQACHEGGEGSDGYQTEAAYHGIQDFGGYIFIVQDVIDGGSLGHENHEEGNIAAGIGEKKGSRHGAHGCAAYAQA